jgi:CcdB protein
MARLDVRRLAGAKSVSLVVEMQAELLQDISTVIVAPLVPAKTLPPIAGVNPSVAVQGQEMLVRLEQLISVPRGRLGAKVDNLTRDEYQIMRALDRLLSRT